MATMQYTTETPFQPRKLHKPLRDVDELKREELVTYSCEGEGAGGGSSGAGGSSSCTGDSCDPAPLP
jgi:hypothetical protein